MNIQELYSLYRQHPSVRTDTRKLRPGDLFFALKGPHFNGNSFAAAALEKGAFRVVVDDPAFAGDSRAILVEDALKTLQELAAIHRKSFTFPFLAITGSNGKTTTKELIREVLSRSMKVYATEGNLNNHIGIPLTLLSIPVGTEVAVIEMGANHPGEIASYCRIVEPTHGIITNCGIAHLEGFGSEEGIRKGKGELFDYLKGHGGTAFVCRDFGYFAEMAEGIPELFWYGTGPGNFVQGHILEPAPLLTAGTDYTGSMHTRLFGGYNLYNILAAVTVGKYFKVPPAAIKAAVEGYAPQNHRSQVITRGSNTIILDSYNANPTSMKLAIGEFASMQAARKVLILGSMMELGAASRKEHESLLELISGWQWEAVVLTGKEFEGLSHPYIFQQDAAAAMAWLEKQHFENTWILVKGSRSMAMEKVLG
ncbi:MAG TPA: UDP-N-acetylmuramoyl-tripeptide--D-alanyl-D-alanine ligase [Chitinophagaceae bacterium]|nr:UDP-N-acetylmuramoyl-tripeptide--D-alanyl-D-alanine ligase [Chitinophagaceae bacterium]